MHPEEVVGAVMLDAGADPVLTPIVVVDFCLKSFAAGKDVIPAIFVVVAIASIRKELQGELAMDRSSEIAQFLVKDLKGFQKVLYLIHEEQGIRVIRFWAHLGEGTVIAGKAGLGQQRLGSPVNGIEAFKNVVKSHGKILLCLFSIIIEDFKGQCRSGHVGGGKKIIPGPMNLHELSRKSCQGWNGQMVIKRQPEGKDALFPVSPELTDDVLNIVLINQDVPIHDRLRGNTVFNALKDFLLVFKGDLGVGNQDRGNKSMGSFTLLAPDALDDEAQKGQT